MEGGVELGGLLDEAGDPVLVVDRDTGKTLYAKAADAAAPIASVTKLMTAIVLLDSKANLDQTIEIVREIANRLTFLVDVGLEYLTLGRQAPSLSRPIRRCERPEHLTAELLVGAARDDGEPPLHQRIRKVARHGRAVRALEHEPGVRLLLLGLFRDAGDPDRATASTGGPQCWPPARA